MKTMQEYAALVDEALATALPQKNGFCDVLYDACSYSLKAGGKRLRPSLVLAAAQYIGVNAKEAMPYALAFEMIHTYSLIHDDLPAMDNDLLRRGKPTNHVIYGEAMAILAGDGLLSYAFETALQGAKQHPEHAFAHIHALNEVAGAAGISGMVAGQAADVHFEKSGDEGKNREELLYYIHENKTAALIRGALLTGLSLGNPDEKTYIAFAEYGKNLGLAFQVADDILDATSSTEIMGKTVGKDEKEGKLTCVALYGLEEAQLHLEKLTDAAICAIRPVDRDGYFETLAITLLRRKH